MAGQDRTLPDLTMLDLTVKARLDATEPDMAGLDRTYADGT